MKGFETAGRKAMKFHVLIQRLPGSRYRASMTSPLAVNAEGATREEALERVRGLIRDQILAGVELAEVDVPQADNPLLRGIGTLDENDPLVREWKEIMRENRRLEDEQAKQP
jgi:hypothetical protein